MIAYEMLLRKAGGAHPVTPTTSLTRQEKGGILGRRRSAGPKRDPRKIHEELFYVSGVRRGDPMTMPNFFIIGAQKAGTTSLYHYLDQHPQIYMSPAKEPFFFNHEINSNGELVRESFGGPGRSWNPVKFTDNPVRFSNLEEYRALF